ncbi:DUF3592 domain-containing protein [Hymenobacter psychrotolerans]|uniref:DUF3592 domain-containing protein n=1 Tax=Hymenobacter psychrotolerans DSM 18569 TaxID=1121959 RepID=A0A1M6X8Z1_9BACT|nr:DUF3592 domain-containing protein [Hymenobacter psychrotolerans]SHL02393.1 Protein of unknown function [Hymenobacter psychrotolerans DSM 18569]
MFNLDSTDTEFLKTMALGVGFLFFALAKLQQRARLQKHGVTAEGVVIRVEREGDVYHPVIRFLTPEQKWITARYDTGTNPSSFTEGEAVQLRFDPGDPTCFIIVSDSSALLTWVFAGIGAGITIYGVGQYLNA